MLKFKVPDSHLREDGSLKDLKKRYTNTGVPIGLETEVVYLPPHKIKINWFQNDGTPVDDSYDGDCKSYLFEVEAEGIDKTLVRKVEFPPLDYSSNEDYLVKITMHILED